MDSCFNSHALRQFEADEAEKERHAIEVEDQVWWSFTADAGDSDKLAAMISDYEVDLSPLVALIFKPLAHADLAAGRIHMLRETARQCFHRYLADQVKKELEK